MIPSDDWNGAYIPLNTPWKAVEGKTFRVSRFTPLAKVLWGKVISLGVTMPFGFLELEGEDRTQVRMVVAHRKDFLCLWEIFEERGVGEDAEVIIAVEPYYRTLRFLNPMMPRFVIRVCQNGLFEYFLKGVATAKPPRIIATWRHGEFDF